MSSVYVVTHVDHTDGFVTNHAFVSAHKASEFRRLNAEADPDGDYFIQRVLIGDADEDFYIGLQRKLSRVQNRLGKSRKAVRELRNKLKLVSVGTTNNGPQYRDPYFDNITSDE